MLVFPPHLTDLKAATYHACCLQKKKIDKNEIEKLCEIYWHLFIFFIYLLFDLKFSSVNKSKQQQQRYLLQTLCYKNNFIHNPQGAKAIRDGLCNKNN